MAVADPDNCSA